MREADKIEKIDGLAIRSEEIGFRPEQMVDCGKCGKKNPPTRELCLYCGAAIIGAHAGKLNARPIETWEKGFNVIAFPDGAFDIASVARYLSFEIAEIERMSVLGSELPLARLESYELATRAADRLAEYGLSCLVVSDDQLSAERPPVRVRSLHIAEGRILLTDFNTAAVRSFERRDLLLIVMGTVLESRTEVFEKRKRKEAKIEHESQTSSDETLIDLYFADDRTGFRIPTRGFDFSCLGPSKTLLAGENMARLADGLSQWASSAVFCAEYGSERQVLELVWPAEAQRDTFGMQRSGFGKTSFTNVTTKSGIHQFTRYSRLRRHLL